MYFEKADTAAPRPIPGAFSAIDAVNLGFKFEVIEDEALTEIAFEGVLDGNGVGGSEIVELGFLIRDDEGNAVNGVADDKLIAQQISGTAIRSVAMRRVYELPAGSYRVQLAGEVGAPLPRLANDAYPGRLSVKVMSNINVVAFNSNVKRQGIA